MMSGRKITISETVERALACLAVSDFHTALLTREQAASMVEERLRKEISSVLIQFVARAMPKSVVRGVTFHQAGIPGGGRLVLVHLDDHEVPLLIGAGEKYPGEIVVGGSDDG